MQIRDGGAGVTAARTTVAEGLLDLHTASVKSSVPSSVFFGVVVPCHSKGHFQNTIIHNMDECSSEVQMWKRDEQTDSRTVGQKI